MRTTLLILFAMLAGWANAQDRLSLDECYTLARNNSPLINRLSLESAMTDLKRNNIRTSDYPALDLNAQATWQSDVTSLKIPIPGIQMNELSKDHYKVTVDARQNIYDGGMKKARLKLEDADYEAEQSKVEADLYQIWNNVSQAYFSALMSKASYRVQEIRRQVLSERLKNLESGVRHGVIVPNDLDVLKVEIMQTDQKLDELNATRRSAVKVLSILTGKTFDLQIELQLPGESLSTEGTRPELLSFDKQLIKFDAASYLSAQKLKPQLYGFMQGGYGRPGLNMLKDSFSPWVMAGVGAHWTITDWKQSKREQKEYALQKEMIETSRSSFLQSRDIALATQQEEITRLENLLKSDEDIVGARERIAHRSASALDNGTLTAADYMT
ncbi:MAG: TolC family protein, partial [Bacteroidota bacterium]|nr:TolC family protein [Bacteroidota bacterium]